MLMRTSWGTPACVGDTVLQCCWKSYLYDLPVIFMVKKPPNVTSTSPVESVFVVVNLRGKSVPSWAVSRMTTLDVFRGCIIVSSIGRCRGIKFSFTALNIEGVISAMHAHVEESINNQTHCMFRHSPRKTAVITCAPSSDSKRSAIIRGNY